jgi:hypothetical protein
MHNICLTENETVDSVNLIAAGLSEMRKPRFAGDIVIDFDEFGRRSTIEVCRIASVMYFYEVFASQGAYPYPSHLERGIREDGISALFFECIGSSYLRRFINGVEWMYGEYRHFGYMDRDDYFWNIIAREIRLTRSPD